MVKKDKNGFTLIEMIIVIVILGIVGLIIGRIINSATRGYQSRAAMKELQSSGRLALDYLESELRYAVPNSVRVLNDHGVDVEDAQPGSVLEYGRTIFGGHYNSISEADMTVDDDLSGLNFSGKWLVVYNDHPADFYGGSSVFPIAGNTGNHITCTTNIDRDSPYRRYYVCDSAVKIGQNGNGLIYYSNYAPGSVEDHGQFLCRKVQSVSFVLQHSQAAEPTVLITLKLESGSLPLTLKRQVRLVNFP
jgi:MSHA biogenesis protein MshO